MRGAGGLGHPPAALDFIRRALDMLQSIGWIAAHRFLFQNRFYKAPPHLAGGTIEAWRSTFRGKAEGTARLVDPVVNGQLSSHPKRPSPKPLASTSSICS
jgi:hypothetical protein